MKEAMGQANDAMTGAQQMQQQAEQHAGMSAGPGGMGTAATRGPGAS